MPLDVRGIDLLSQGEFSELMKGLGPGHRSGVMAAWYMGHEIPPDELHLCLDVECRLQAETPRAVELIERCLETLERCFPDEVPSP